MMPFLFWLAVVLGLIAWIFTRSWNDFPEEGPWEIWFRGGGGKHVVAATCYCKISVVIQIVDAMNQDIIGGKYYYKRSGG